MSLLMDALKRAEEEKAKRLGNSTVPAVQEDVASTGLPDLVLDAEVQPASTTPPPPQSPSVDSDNMSLLDDEFFEPASNTGTYKASPMTSLPPLRGVETTSTAAPAPRTQRPPEPMSEAQVRLQAQNILDTGGPKQEGVRKGFLAIIGIGTLTSCLGIGYYVWKNTRTTNSWAVATNISANVPRATVPVAPSPAPVSGTSPAPATTTNSATAPQQGKAAETETGVGTGLHTFPKEEISSISPQRTRVRNKNFESPSRQSMRPKSKGQLMEMSINDSTSLLQSGQQALQDDKLDLAVSWFTKAQQNKNDEIPALLGLAAVDLRRGQPQAAAQRYLRILELDPRNTVSEVSLLSLQGKFNTDETIDRLNMILQQDPNQPLPNFVLGNLYAGKSRWQEAQRAYFNAYQFDSANPDYLYNLAVSLDHLNQPSLARQYYQQALDALQSRAGRFDHSLVEKRLLILAQ